MMKDRQTDTDSPFQLIDSAHPYDGPSEKREKREKKREKREKKREKEREGEKKREKCQGSIIINLHSILNSMMIHGVP